MAKLQLLDLTR